MKISNKKRKSISKSLLSLVIAAIIAFSGIASAINFNVFSQAPLVDIWDGKTFSKPLGDGSSEQPYQISNGAELAWYISLFSDWKSVRYATLTDDIYLNDISKINWETGEVDSEYSVNDWLYYTNESDKTINDPYLGNLDGDGHIIYGMYYNKPTSSADVSLIPYQHKDYTATVKNLGIENCYIATAGRASAFFANAEGLDKTIDNCYAGKSVTIVGNYAGVAVAMGQKFLINKFYSLATVIGTNFYGIIGDSWSDKYIENSYVYGTVITSKTSNCIPCNNVYANNTLGGIDAVKLNVEKMKGTEVLSNPDKMSALDSCKAFVATEGFPILKTFDGRSKVEDEEIPDVEIWSGTPASGVSEGDGSKENPYRIANGEELAWYIGIFSDWKSVRYAVLTNDIYLNDISKINWITGAVKPGYKVNNWLQYTNKSDKTINDPFLGNLDGNGHTIYGMYYNKPSSNANVGLIPFQSKDYKISIKNLGIDNVYISTSGYASAIFASADGIEKEVENCFIGKNVTVKGEAAGAVMAYGYKLSIDKFYSFANASGNSFYGIIGDSWGDRKLENAYICGTVITSKIANSIECKNVYSKDNTGGINAVTITEDNMKGIDVLSNLEKMPGLDICGAFKARKDDFPILKLFYNGEDEEEEPQEGNIWSGKVASKIKDGDGSKENPYQITNGEELAWYIGVFSDWKKTRYAELKNDIYLNNIEKINWKTGEVESGYKVNNWLQYTNNSSKTIVDPFLGSLNGKGYVIYGMYFNNLDSKANVGLIPYQHNNYTASVMNLGIENAYISTGGNASALFALAEGDEKKIENCYVGENVTLIGNSAGSAIAYGQKFSIDMFYSLAEVCGDEFYGLVGDTWSSPMQLDNAYIVGSPITSKKSNPLVCSEVYAEDILGGTGAVARETKSMKGLDVLTNSDKMADLDSCDAFVATEEYPVLAVFTDEGIKEREPEGNIWSGRVAKKIEEGDGTKENPFVIKNGAELARAIKKNGFDGSYFVLNNDIYLNDVSDVKWYNNNNNKWIASTGFDGHIDGRGFIVYGLWYSDDTKVEDAGLIPVWSNGSIKNLGVRYSQIRSRVNAGAIVGRTNKGGKKTIDSCFADDSNIIKYTTENAGGASGIIGQADYDCEEDVALKITNCYSKAKLSGADKNRINGIIGTAWKNNYLMSDCYSRGFAPYYAGNENTCSFLYNNGKKLSEIYKNIYSDGREPECFEKYTFVSNPEDMIGEKAKKSMPNLDYNNVFEIVENGSPKLKIFTSISGEDIDVTGDSLIYSKGNGTKQEPFSINDASQLQYLLQSENTKGKYYSIDSDIYLNNTKNKDWKKMNPLKWYDSKNSKPFDGYIDGNGHKIFGLFFDETPSPKTKNDDFDEIAVGLFPTVSAGAVIRNIHIRDSYVSGRGITGSLVGSIVETDNKLYLEVIGCSADETVTVKGQVVGGLVAGFAKRGLKLYCSYFTGNVEATDSKRTNALVGDIWSTDWEMIECYFVGNSAHRTDYLPSISGANYGDVAISSAKYLTKKQMTGADAQKYMKEFEWNTVWKTVKNSTPQLKVIPADKEMKIFDSGKKGSVWSGYRAVSYASGKGTKEEPYIIETPEQLARLVDLDTDSDGKYYKLTADIYLNDVSKKDWQKNARDWFSGDNKFAGHFDGNGHVVYGLYYDTSFAKAALFQTITSGAVIEHVGISKASITSIGNSDKEAYAAALVALVAGWDVEDFVRPIIRECFADHTVSVNSYFTGGLIAGCGMYFDMENCYFTGSLKSDKYIGQAVGNVWGSFGKIKISNSYFMSSDGSPLAQNISSANIIIENVYQSGKRGNVSGTKGIASMLIRGDGAKEYMPKLDYANIWQIVDGGTPVLRCFKNAKHFSLTEMPQKVEISFASNGGSPCNNISGYPLYTKLTKDMLPTPTRYGYEFAGWYHFRELVSPVTETTFPNFNTVFYAKWNPVGFTVDFEGNLDAKYDYNSNVEHFKPGVKGYSPLFVKNGFKALHVKQTNDSNAIFLISFENALTIGQEYDITFNVNTDNKDVAAKDFKLIHANHPQYNSDEKGYQNLKFEGLRKGIWSKQKFTVVANAPYLLVELNSNASLYFDDIQVTPTSKKGEIGNLIQTEANTVTDKNYVLTIVFATAIVSLIAITSIAVLIIKKRRK